MRQRYKRSGNHYGLQGVTLCISTAMVLILLGMVVFSVLAAHNMSTYVKEHLLVTMTFQDDVTHSEAQQVCAKLRRHPYITSVNFISKEQALAEQKRAMGTDPSEFIGMNPFLSSIEIRLKGDYANNDSLAWITKDLQRYPKVGKVSYERGLVESVNQTLQKFSVILLVLAALLTFVSFSLINSSTRLDIYSRRFSIHIMKLVGASWGFIRRPFVCRAIAVGVVAALIAVGVLGACLYALYCSEPDVLLVVTPDVIGITVVSVFFFGIVITGICANLSVTKFLKMKASELYKI